MSNPIQNRTAVILLNMGGPQALDEVREYLYQIFSDRDIIRFPGGRCLQPVFAWMISRLRAAKVKDRYRMIGGASPQLKYAEAQKEHLCQSLQSRPDAPAVFVGMRYTRPFIAEAIGRAYAEGCREFVFLPLYPHYCAATTGSSFKVARRVMQTYADARARYIDDFHDYSGYITLLKSYIADHREPDETLLFSAHSIPQDFVDHGDPYVDQVRRTCALVSGQNEYYIAFQSRTGPVNWVGPDTVQETMRLIADQHRVFLVPVSFVSDHIETLYEIDHELKEHLPDNKRSHLRRMPMFNEDVRFGQMLADLFVENNQRQQAENQKRKT